jgi:hypothetical protein
VGDDAMIRCSIPVIDSAICGATIGPIAFAAA